MTHWIYWLTILCWAVLCLVWVIGWIYNLLKAPATQKRSMFLPAGIACVVAIILIVQFIPHHFWALLTLTVPWLQIVGVACLIIFTAFTLWARWTLGIMWSFAPEIKIGHQLRTDGPYRITRHPIYTGFLGMALGTVLISEGGVWILVFAIMVVVFAIKIASEERLLKETFGEQYTQYQHDVPQLIPGLQLLTRRS
jgi:protein-S-isoprenylcysteine O-methyltransferase Ste14